MGDRQNQRALVPPAGIGLWARPEGINRVFEEKSIYKQLALSDLTNPTMFLPANVSETTTHYAYAYVVARIANENERASTPTMIDTIIIGELFRFDLPAGYRAENPEVKYIKTWFDLVRPTNDQSTLKLIQVAGYNFTGWKNATAKPANVSAENWAALADPYVDAGNIDTWVTAFVAGSLNPAADGSYTANQRSMASYINSLLAFGIPLTQPNLTRRLWITAFISFLKRGECTDHYIKKMVDGFTGWFQGNAEISRATIKSVYAIYGSGVTPAVMQTLCTYLKAAIPTTAIRAQVAVDQAEWSGLAAYQLIVETIQTYPKFYWTRLRSIGVYETEWNAFLTACRAVRRNAFYGFNRNLGPARSTQFPNLASVCKAISIKCGANISLESLKSVSNKYQQMGVIQPWIDAFDQGRVDLARLAGIEADEDATLNEMIAAIGPAPANG